MTDHTVPKDQDTVPFYPDHVRTELKVAIWLVAIVVGLGIIGLISPLGLGAPADPFDTPAHVKPEWYFLALYQMLKFIPKTLGVILPVAAVGILALWPFIDRKPDADRRILRRRFIFVTIAMIILIAATIWGEVS